MTIQKVAAHPTHDKETLHVLRLFNTPILQQLQIEEALLRADDRNWCIMNTGSPAALVMGISGKPCELINRERFILAPVPVIQRFSGGGTVFIDHNTYFVSFICNSVSIPISPFPEHIMRWTEQIYSPLFPLHFFQLREHDYVLGHQKFGGNAQAICKNRWLHHSSFLWDYSNANMEYLRHPPKAPTYRAQRPHSAFLCRLSDYWSHARSFHETVIDQLELIFAIKRVVLPEIADVLNRPHRQATTLITDKVTQYFVSSN